MQQFHFLSFQPGLFTKKFAYGQGGMEMEAERYRLYLEHQFPFQRSTGAISQPLFNNLKKDLIEYYGFNK
jgi:hypothetical protein